MAEPRSHYRLTFAVLAVSSASFALLQSLVIPVLGRIQTELGTSQTTVTWVLTAYLLSASVFTPSSAGSATESARRRCLSPPCSSSASAPSSPALPAACWSWSLLGPSRERAGACFP